MTVCSTTGTYTYDRNVQVLWAETITNVQIPTSAEIVTGGINLTADPYCLTDIIGWEIETDVIRGGWGPMELQRMGKQKVADSRFVFAAQRSAGSGDIRNLWARGDTGYIVILPSGPYLDYPDAPVNVYPVRIAQLTQQQRLRTGQGSLILASLIITARCGENVNVVAP